MRFGARDYDPQVGRWVSKDPILFGGRQANIYVYAGNDPVNLRDPSGLFWCELGCYIAADAEGMACRTINNGGDKNDMAEQCSWRVSNMLDDCLQQCPPPDPSPNGPGPTCGSEGTGGAPAPNSSGGMSGY